MIPAGDLLPAPDDRLSRFLAKVGLEQLALRCLPSPDALDWLIDNDDFDPLREHALRNRHRPWPTSVRRIYPASARVTLPDGTTAQTMHEKDLLFTERSEGYLVIALFGIEMVMNLGGPDLDGYWEWLEAHEGISPLYTGRNMPEMPQARDAM